MAPFIFWIFQIINGLSALGLFLNPKKVHESTFREPERVYRDLGFSKTAVEMLHNVLRGQGAALLAISVFLAVEGARSRTTYLLIAIGCGLTLLAHLMTLRHHRGDAAVLQSIGSLRPMYFMIVINLVLAASATWIYFRTDFI